MPFLETTWRVRSRRAVAAAAIAAAFAANAATVHARAVHVTHGSIASVRDCELRYRVHRPAGDPGRIAVVIAHGYLRDGAHMAGWAEAVAAAGVTAVTVDLCAAMSGEGRHADNGTDMVALRRALGLAEVIYVGVSAGGLAALVAGSLDAVATRGLLLLDPVNAGGQARAAAGKVRAPVAALVAKSQVCNAWRNFDPALATLDDVTIVRVPKASHCDFEWPGDQLCRVLCVATNSHEAREHAQDRIRRVGVAFLLAAASGRPEALADWRGDIGPD